MGWNDLPQNVSSGGNFEGGQVPFLKIGTDVTVRMLSEPEIYMKHFTFTISGKQTVIRCPGRDGCMVCHREGKPKVRAMFLVYDRADNVIKLYDAPQTVAAQIKSLMAVWGNLAEYDLKISKLGNTKRTDYQVVPLPKSPLTQADVDKIKVVLSTFNLKSATRPHTAEEINAILNEQPVPGRNQPQGQAAPQNVNMGGQNQVAGFTKYGDQTPPPQQNIPPATQVYTQNSTPSVPYQAQPQAQPQNLGAQRVNVQVANNSAPAGGTTIPQGNTASTATDASYFNKFL